MSTVEYITAEELRVDTTWWEIYEESFPSSEREPPEVILESALGGVGMVFRARQGAMTLGLATIHILKNPPAVFLVYLAVSKKERSQGIGAELFDLSWQSGSGRLREQHLEPCGMVWEIDPPQAGDGAASAPQRRIEFFQKHGGQLLDYRYVQPPVDGIASVPMLLMFRPGKGRGTPNSTTVDAIVRAIYFEKYGAINRIDGSILEDLLSPR
jgi:hypothetical protein